MSANIMVITAALGCALVMQGCMRTEKETGKTVSVTDLSAQPHQTGDTSWTRYWQSSLAYPKEAKDKQLEGRVIVKFTVDEGGRVVNPVIAKSTDPIFSDAALENIKKMPKWIPAEKYGRKVAVDMYQPYLFTLGFNKSTTVTTMSADSSQQTIQCFANSIPSLYTQMLHGDDAARDKLKKIDEEERKITAANRAIADAQKKLVKAQKEMAAIQRKAAK